MKKNGEVMMGTRNTSLDLNNHLFEQLERLNDEGLTSEELEVEIERSKALTDVSKQIIENSKVALDAQKLKAEYTGQVTIPNMIEASSSE